MGCNILEYYYFVGSVDGVKRFHDFLKPLAGKNYCGDFLKEKYPVDKRKLNNTSFGFYINLDEIKTADGLSGFHCQLENRDSISAFVFKEFLDNYFSGVYIYFCYIGDSVLAGSFNTNDREKRFFSCLQDTKNNVEFYIEEIYAENAGISEPTVEQCHAIFGDHLLFENFAFLDEGA